MASMQILGGGPPRNVQMAKEKPEHTVYLQDFRVEPCSLFKQHTCQNHRPYTCFFWHFANQRRRQSILKSDGTFNYSPDIYCVKYDESTGICPDDDKCTYLHRVYGDVERKFHLRYYKTTLCVHATESSGQCSKNGVHCPFAHGPSDIREPVFERKDNEMLTSSCDGAVELLDNRDRLSYVVEDPVWEDQEHVLAFYKTELCKKPPRLCRQGYACPFYHNSKDRRRSPLDFKYRSTPCPSVKHADEWSCPESCDSADGCSYCHTRTEQQFHPEIYKSSKCNDILLHGYCPRSTFCAFAHTDAELCAERLMNKKHRLGSGASAIGCFPSSNTDSPSAFNSSALEVNRSQENVSPYVDALSGRSLATGSESSISYSAVLKQQRRYTMPTPRSGKIDQENASAYTYPKAPGFERGLQSPYRDRACSSLLPSSGDKSSRAVMGFYDLANYDSGILSSTQNLTGEYYSSIGEQSNRFDQVENLDALIGSLADELNVDDVLLPTISENEEKSCDVLFPYAAMTYTSTQTTAGQDKQSLPFDSNAYGRTYLNPAGVCNGVYNLNEENARLRNQLPQGDFALRDNQSYRESMDSFGHSQPADSVLTYQEKLPASKYFSTLDADECLLRTKKTCEVWKREAEEQRRRAQIAEQEKMHALNERDKALNQLACVQFEVQLLKNGSVPISLNADSLTNAQLEELKNRLQMELEKVNRRLENNAGPMCARCGRHVNDRLPSVHCPVCTPSCKVASSSSAVA